MGAIRFKYSLEKQKKEQAKRKWIHLSQKCLVHLIRKAKALSETKDKVSKHFGKKILKELRLLCH